MLTVFQTNTNTPGGGWSADAAHSLCEAGLAVSHQTGREGGREGVVLSLHGSTVG